MLHIQWCATQYSTFGVTYIAVYYTIVSECYRIRFTRQIIHVIYLTYLYSIFFVMNCVDITIYTYIMKVAIMLHNLLCCCNIRLESVTAFTLQCMCLFVFFTIFFIREKRKNKFRDVVRHNYTWYTLAEYFFRNIYTHTHNLIEGFINNY